ncbi:hypothetical protein AGABI1DRAFT_109057 [Agaricus bisporus var. burnettii JB137-S8]|uniref:DUF6533 domain-containing protein n=1 Tax=Agaricus bisporus var. burnettii (strain JB137-S8 / ATCC MYA-4627 / FGSC 10392) TaxID=597362 RepID=K5XMW2_AGABU|nr:uncharacterized protein AGABI1DRAFT_109057 [Agaricus bisporus var. burnettii JB137-S8]EKM75955.1 hypothetical protein AGABI1DRAFT_109057 [Agaricus bisporus var. burnettii JB137-S8]
MSGLAMNEIQKLAKGLDVSRDFGYSNVVGSAVVYFDWLLTLDAEIKLVWNAKGSKMKVLYLLTRYLPLVYSPLLLYYRFGNPTVSECTAVYRSIGILFTVAAICAALVVTLRTWAVWDLKKPMTYLLFGTYTVTSILILVLYIISWKYTSHSVISGLPLGCIPEFQSFYLPAGFVSEAAYDTLILLLMLVRGASLLL